MHLGGGAGVAGSRRAREGSGRRGFDFTERFEGFDARTDTATEHGTVRAMVLDAGGVRSAGWDGETGGRPHLG